MTKRLLVLLPPSQAKSSGGRRAAREGAFDVVLDGPRREVAATLGEFMERASPRELETVFDARGELLQRAIAGAREVISVRAPLMPAWRRYQGIVWSHLDPASLTPGLRRRVLIPSGLYGLLSAEDAIADYRLRMNARMKPLPSLAHFWRPLVTPLVIERARNMRIVNFLPQEHAASIDLQSLTTTNEVINVHFVAHDEQRAVGHDAKAVKGVLARRVLIKGLDDIDSVGWEGWRVRRQGSDIVATAPRTRLVPTK